MCDTRRTIIPRRRWRYIVFYILDNDTRRAAEMIADAPPARLTDDHIGQIQDRITLLHADDTTGRYRTVAITGITPTGPIWTRRNTA